MRLRAADLAARETVADRNASRDERRSLDARRTTRGGVGRLPAGRRAAALS
jgi:hypothetical protein